MKIRRENQTEHRTDILSHAIRQKEKFFNIKPKNLDM